MPQLVLQALWHPFIHFRIIFIVHGNGWIVKGKMVDGYSSIVEADARIDPYRTAMHVASLHLLWCNLVPAASNSRQDAKNSGVIVSPGATSGTPGG